MKAKILLISALFLGFATTTRAQFIHEKQPANVSVSPNPQMHNNLMPAPEARAQAMTNQLSKELKLTAAQKADMYKVNLRLEQRMDEARQKRDMNLKRQILIDRVAAYKKILTPAQFQESGLDQLESKLNATNK